MFEFGNWLTRLLRGGVLLAPAEQWLLAQLVSALPKDLRAVVEAQLHSYNLAQREVDGRAINFYPRPAFRSEMPLLNSPPGSVPLVRLTVSAPSANGPIHATLNAVSGRVFCMALNRSVLALPVAELEVTHVTEAWRSNFPGSAPNKSFKPNPLRGSA